MNKSNPQKSVKRFSFNSFGPGLLPCLLLVAMTLATGAAVQAEEISVALLGDSYIDRDAPDINFGGEDRLDAHYGIVGRAPGGGAHYLIRNVLLQFDQEEIAAIPDDVTITRATLEAFLDSADDSDRVYMEVAVINAEWDESTVTWNGLADRYAFPRSPRITSHAPGAGWMQWDVTRIVRHWKSGFYDNHGLLLTIYLESGGAIEDYSRMFISKEGDASQAPRLRIEYEATPPETDVDLRITNLEINQVVQVLDDIATPTPGVDNSVALIADKPTVVRVYIDIGPAVDPVPGVTAYLYRVGTTSDERIAPMAPITAVPAPDRENRHHSINFRLPEDWLQGTLDFYVELNPSTLSMRVPETDYTNNRFPADGSFVNVDFEGPGRAADIAWMRLNYTWTGWTGAAMARDRVGNRETADLARAVFPLPPHNVRYRFWPGGNIDWDADINNNTGLDFRAELIRIYDLSTADPKPLFLACFVPEGAYSGRGKSDPPYNGGSGNVVFVNDEDPDMFYRVIFTHELGHNMNCEGHRDLPYNLLPDNQFGYDVCDIDRLHRIVMRHYIDPSGVPQRLIEYMRGGTSITLPDGTVIWLDDGDEAWVTAHVFNFIHAYATTSGVLDSATDFGEKGGDSTPDSAAKVLMIGGMVEKEAGGKFTPFFQLADRVPDRSRDGGEFSIELYDAEKNRLSAFQFDVAFGIDDFVGEPVTKTSFSFMVPYEKDPQTIVLKRRDKVLDQVEVSANVPEVTIVSPNRRQTLSGVVPLHWKGTDKDDDALTYAVLYSRDKGLTWIALASNLKATEFAVKTDELPGSEQVIFRVMVTDGVNTAYDDTDESFIIEQKKPRVSIVDPAGDTHCRLGEELLFIGQGYDLEDGALDGKSLNWTSDRDGRLGEGTKINLEGLSQGVHQITLTGTDRDGSFGQDSRSVFVSAAEAVLPSDQELAQQVALEVAVIDAQTRQPLPNTSVTLRGEQQAAASVGVSTNSLGLALLKAPTVGTYALEASQSGYETWIETLSLSRENKRLDIALEKSTPSEAILLLQVLDRDQGAPIAYAQATVRRGADPLSRALRVTTDKQGECEIEVAQAGDFSILVRAEDYEPGGAKTEVLPGKVNVVKVMLVRPRPDSILAMVTDARTGKTLPDARVFLRKQGQTTTASAATDDLGQARLKSSGPGRYMVSAEREGYERWSEQRELRTASENLPIELVPVARTPLVVVVSGRVVSDTPAPGSNSLGVEGAELLWRSTQASSELETSGQGRFKLELPPGEYRVLAKAPGHENLATQIAVFEQMPEVQLVMRRTTLPTLALRVLGRSPSVQAVEMEPIEEALVDIYLGSRRVARGSTNPDGTYSASLPSGSYTLRVAHPEFEPVKDTIIMTDSDARRQILLKARETTPDSVTLALLIGTRERMSIRPLDDAEIEIFDSGKEEVMTGRSNRDGAFSTRLPPGSYLVRVFCDGFTPEQSQVQLQSRSVEKRVLLAPIVEVRQLNVRVVTASSGGKKDPLPDANVEIYRRDKRVAIDKSDSDGLSQSSLPDSGTFTLQVSKQGYKTMRTTVSVGSVPVSREVMLRPIDSLPEPSELTLQLVVQDPGGKPIPTASVVITRGSVVVAKGASDGAGRYTERLSRGSYAAKVSHRNYKTVDKQFSLTTSRTQRIVLEPVEDTPPVTTSATLTVAVRLRHPDGSKTLPFNEATVEVLQNKKLIAKGQTGKDGICRPPFSLTPGQYEVRASKTGYESRSMQVLVKAGRVTQTVTLDPPSVD